MSYNFFLIKFISLFLSFFYLVSFKDSGSSLILPLPLPNHMELILSPIQHPSYPCTPSAPPTPAEDRALLPLPNCMQLVFASLLLPNHIELILLSTQHLPCPCTPRPLPLNLTMIVVRPSKDLLFWCTDHQNGLK